MRAAGLGTRTDSSTVLYMYGVPNPHGHTDAKFIRYLGYEGR